MADLLEVATEPTRRRLLQMLANGDHSVIELAEEFSVSRSAISQHLLRLVEVGLVEARKEGRNRFYSLDQRGMARLRQLFDSFWTNELDRLVSDAAAMPTRNPQGEP